jgi:hypothetical protein
MKTRDETQAMAKQRDDKNDWLLVLADLESCLRHNDPVIADRLRDLRYEMRDARHTIQEVQPGSRPLDGGGCTPLVQAGTQAVSAGQDIPQSQTAVQFLNNQILELREQRAALTERVRLLEGALIKYPEELHRVSARVKEMGFGDVAPAVRKEEPDMDKARLYIAKLHYPRDSIGEHYCLLSYRRGWEDREAFPVLEHKRITGQYCAHDCPACTTRPGEKKDG